VRERGEEKRQRDCVCACGRERVPGVLRESVSMHRDCGGILRKRNVDDLIGNTDRAKEETVDLVDS
jgi:hypothetical protein